MEDVAAYIADGRARRILVMLGAGVSVSAGIPDFRTPGSGLYANLQKFNLPSPAPGLTAHRICTNSCRHGVAAWAVVHNVEDTKLEAPSRFPQRHARIVSVHANETCPRLVSLTLHAGLVLTSTALPHRKALLFVKCQLFDNLNV